MTDDKIFHHRGLAESLGVTQDKLENMSLRELAERAYDKGGEIKVSENGIAPGLTLTGPKQDDQRQTNQKR